MADHIKQEDAPDGMISSQPMQISLKAAEKLVGQTIEALDRCKNVLDDNEGLTELLAEAKAFSKFRGQGSKIIAVLGDSGEGKSHLINSLLEVPDLAKTGGNGQACTSVVTEYRQKKEDQTAAILIEVDFCTRNEIEELIKELLWDYRRFYLPHVETSETSAQDYNAWKAASERAWSALESAFKHHPGFSQELLKAAVNENVPKIEAKLILWASTIRWPNGSENGTYSTTANDVQGCYNTTDMFTQDRFWPFTKVMRVYVDAHVLRTGIVLADMPGLRDTNLARVRATQEYLFKCDLFLCCGNIARAATSQSLKDMIDVVSSVISRNFPTLWENNDGAQQLPFAIVCTMADTFNPNDLRRDFCGEGKPVSKSEMVAIEDKIGEGRLSKNYEMMQSYTNLKAAILMGARNTSVKKKIKNTYATKVRGRELDVFCVANSWYDKFMEQDDGEMVEQSGILELRRYCSAIAARMRSIEESHYAKVSLPSLLNSVEIWLLHQQRNSVRTNIPTAEPFGTEIASTRTRTNEVIKEAERDFTKIFSDNFSQFFIQREHTWEEAAIERYTQWESWHWTQFNSWCMHDGENKTKGRGFVNWNAELVWKMRLELDESWQMLLEDLRTSFDAMCENLRKTITTCKASAAERGMSDAVLTNIDFHIATLTHQAAPVYENFVRELRKIRCYAIEPCGNSYMLAQMLPAYRAASSEYGTGKAKRQKQRVSDKVKEGRIFLNISYEIRTGVQAAITVAGAAMSGVVEAVLNRIEADVARAPPGNLPRVTQQNLRALDGLKELSIAIADAKKQLTLIVQGFAAQ